MRKVLLIGAVAILACSLAAEPALGATDLMRRSKALVVAYDLRSGDQQWRLPTNAPGHAAVVAATNDRVFVELSRCLSLDRDDPRDHELLALDARTGEVAWRRHSVSSRDLEPASKRWHPAGLTPSARVLPIEDEHQTSVQALDVKTGRPRWKVDANGLHAVATTNDEVILTSERPNESLRADVRDVTVRVLEATTGETRWERVVASSGKVRVAAGPTAVAVLSLPNSPTAGALVETLDLDTGATMAQAPFVAPGVNVFDDDVEVTPEVVAVGGFTGGGPQRTVGLDIATGTTRWTVDGHFVTTDPKEPRALYGSMFGSDEDPRLRDANAPHVGKLDTTTGVLIWNRDTPGWLIGHAKDTLVIARGTGYEDLPVLESLGGLDPTDGAVRWDIVPGPDARAERHFPNTFTVSSYAGPNGAYVSGGCALTTSN